jgi:hypothetical protein
MLKAYVRRALELPLHVVVEKALRLAARVFMQRLRRLRDLLASTYEKCAPARMVPRLSLTAVDVPASLKEVLPELCGRYLKHNFDLLGSGWVQVRHGLAARGLEGYRFPAGPGVVPDQQGDWLAERVTHANYLESSRLWRLVEGSYQPIDWQIDFKSGYRWNERRHFRDLTFGDCPGVDVKVPWELARLQHLPQLATAHLLAKSNAGGFGEPAAYAREIRNQILDFLATNPPRFGVNWLCPMDVGIRAANMLIAVDMLRAGGAVIDEPFEAAVADAAVAHGRYIIENLEWSTAPRSNHYLADIAGILFCAVYLPASDECDAWLDFAAQQLGEEISRQFLADGGNFEGSTNYHRLSAELVLFCTAALLGIAVKRESAFISAARHRLRVKPGLGRAMAGATKSANGSFLPLPEAAVALLEKAVAGVAGWSKPNGCPPQVGDTDSGRLFKLHPSIIDIDDPDPHENLLDHRALPAIGIALFDAPPRSWSASGPWYDETIAASLAGDHKLRSRQSRPAVSSTGDLDALKAVVNEIKALPSESRREIFFELPHIVPGNLQGRMFPDFGLYVFQNDTTFISLRCAANLVGGSHTMGHYHDDNLALELYDQGIDLIADPGSYLYTPLASVRNQYRQAAAHFVPRPANYEAAEAISPFAMRFVAEAQCVYFGAAGVAAILKGKNWQALRAVTIEEGRVTVFDGCSPGPLRGYSSTAVSNGYGCMTGRKSFNPGHDMTS